MKQLFRLWGLVALCVALGGTPVYADILYDNVSGTGLNGPDTLGISLGASITDSFVLSSDAIVTRVNFGAWLFPGDTLNTVEWSITTAPFGGGPESTAAIDFQALLIPGGGQAFDGYFESFSVPNVSLSAGVHWLQLEEASTASGLPAFWDVSPGGGSIAYANEDTTTPLLFSHTFQIEGTAVPEPGGILLLLSGLGGMTLLLIRRRICGQAPQPALRANRRHSRR